MEQCNLSIVVNVMDLALGGSVRDEKLKETVKNIIFRKALGVQMDENGTLRLKKRGYVCLRIGP